MNSQFNKKLLPLAISALIWHPVEDALAAETDPVSINTSGKQGNSDSLSTSASADGRYIVFSSKASNLVAGDANGKQDIFVLDRLTGKIRLVSVDSAGVQGNGDSWAPSISADGAAVAFASSAANLIAGVADTNAASDVFVHNLATGKTTRVSVNSAGKQGNSWSDNPSISGDGRVVAFDSMSSNLVANDTNLQRDVFVHFLTSGKTGRVSVDSAEQQTTGYSEDPSISADGKAIAFMSKGSLVPEDLNGRPDIYVRDIAQGATVRVSVDSAGAEAGNWSGNPSISGDGQVVAFESKANNLVPNDSNGIWDVFAHNRTTGVTSRVSVNSAGEEGNNYSLFPAVSADGRTVAFYSPATNLVAHDTNGVGDVFVHSLVSGKTALASLDSAGRQGNNISEGPALNADGRIVAFSSLASNLVPNDTNNAQDAFVRDRMLDNSLSADMQLEVTAKPASVQQGRRANYTFTITNNGPDSAKAVRLVDVIAGGSLISLTPSQGDCVKAAVSVCRFGTLKAGASATLAVAVKAVSDPLTQYVSVSAAPKDVAPPFNNSTTVSTPVTP